MEGLLPPTAPLETGRGGVWCALCSPSQEVGDSCRAPPGRTSVTLPLFLDMP